MQQVVFNPETLNSREYVFVKVVYMPIFEQQIRESSIPLSLLSKIEAQGNLVKITTTNYISPDIESVLKNIVSKHRSMDVERVQVQISIENAMDFGRSLIAEFGAENVLLGFNTNQVKYIANKYSPVISLLITGSLKSALSVIEVMPPDALIPAERIKRYANKIRTYLGMKLL